MTQLSHKILIQNKKYWNKDWYIQAQSVGLYSIILASIYSSTMQEPKPLNKKINKNVSKT